MNVIGQMLGVELGTFARFVIAFLFVLALIAVAAWLLRRFGGQVLAEPSARGRQPRLGILEATAVDARRRMVLVRRDNVEHLILIGGPADLVIESNIVRGPSQAARPPVAVQPVPQPVPAPQIAPQPVRRPVAPPPPMPADLAAATRARPPQPLRPLASTIPAPSPTPAPEPANPIPAPTPDPVPAPEPIPVPPPTPSPVPQPSPTPPPPAPQARSPLADDHQDDDPRADRGNELASRLEQALKRPFGGTRPGAGNAGPAPSDPGESRSRATPTYPQAPEPARPELPRAAPPVEPARREPAFEPAPSEEERFAYPGGPSPRPDRPAPDRGPSRGEDIRPAASHPQPAAAKDEPRPPQPAPRQLSAEPRTDSRPTPRPLPPAAPLRPAAPTPPAAQSPQVRPAFPPSFMRPAASGPIVPRQDDRLGTPPEHREDNRPAQDDERDEPPFMPAVRRDEPRPLPAEPRPQASTRPDESKRESSANWRETPSPATPEKRDDVRPAAAAAATAAPVDDLSDEETPDRAPPRRDDISVSRADRPVPDSIEDEMASLLEEIAGRDRI